MRLSRRVLSVLSALWIKICGTTRAEDAEAAAKLGADAVGLILFEGSSRAVELNQCAGILEPVAGSVAKVAVLVNPSQDFVEQLLAVGVFDLLQFHGDESESFCSQFRIPYMKAIRVRDYEQAQQQIQRYASAEKILLDSYIENVPGGTGKTFDWDIAAKLVATNDKDVVLAGGLSANNVAEAAAIVKPFGVDAVSGIEAQPGVKDHSKLEKFIEATKSVAS